MRREIRRLSPDVKIQIESLRELLMQEVVKREVIEGEKAEAARRKVQKAALKWLRARKEKEEPAPLDVSAPPEEKTKMVVIGPKQP